MTIARTINVRKLSWPLDDVLASITDAAINHQSNVTCRAVWVEAALWMFCGVIACSSCYIWAALQHKQKAACCYERSTASVAVCLSVCLFVTTVTPVYRKRVLVLVAVHRPTCAASDKRLRHCPLFPFYSLALYTLHKPTLTDRPIFVKTSQALKFSFFYSSRIQQIQRKYR